MLCLNTLQVQFWSLSLLWLLRLACFSTVTIPDTLHCGFLPSLLLVSSAPGTNSGNSLVGCVAPLSSWVLFPPPPPPIPPPPPSPPSTSSGFLPASSSRSPSSNSGKAVLFPPAPPSWPPSPSTPPWTSSVSSGSLRPTSCCCCCWWLS